MNLRYKWYISPIVLSNSLSEDKDGDFLNCVLRAVAVNNNLRKKYKLVFLIQSLKKNLRVKSKRVLAFHNNFS